MMPLCFLPFLLLFLTPTLTMASKKSYVVYMGVHLHGTQPSTADLEKATNSHYLFLGSFLGSREIAMESIFYSYSRHINGFAANLDQETAALIAKHPKVVSVFENKGRKLHTTRSWEFLGVDLDHHHMVPAYSIWNKSRFGEDTIVGNLDTGVWPESKSFNDYGYGPIPSRWKGICQNEKDATFHCNRKLIGARYFNKGYAAGARKGSSFFNSSLDTPRDEDGHGSHTLSTAAGNFVPNASVFGFGKGTAKGGSPRARVAAYKVCWPPVAGNECFDSDIIAAFDAAIHDGVDVLSVSLGGDPGPLFEDGVAVGSFHAIMRGIVVVCSAGNSGPGSATVSNLAPWQITVGASTMDRDFPSFVILGNKLSFKGSSLSTQTLPQKSFSLISAADAKAENASTKDALLCKPGALDASKVRGKILVCLRGVNARVNKGQQAALAGAIGMVLANDVVTGNEIIADAHVLPASHISYTDGLVVFDHVKTTKFPVGYISPASTHVGTKPAPFMAAFSSKGPNSIIPDILKPDITAPGVSVIAAYTEAQGPTNEDYDKRRVKFNSVSGTSMSCPHVSGIVGLLKTLYPHWSPSAIKSAIMTTATTFDNLKEKILNASNMEATSFSYGAGHVQPNLAMDPGLVYDSTERDYLNFICALGYNETLVSLFSEKPYRCPEPGIRLSDFNYPSITVSNLSPHSATVTRTVTNVGSPGTYRAHVEQPAGVSVSVKPKTLKFTKVGEEKTFRVTLKIKNPSAAKDYVFGKLVWSDDNKHRVGSPIIVNVASTSWFIG